MTFPAVSTDRDLVKIVKDYAPYLLKPERAKALRDNLMNEIKKCGKRVSITFAVSDYENFHWSGTWSEAGVFLALLNDALRPLLKENA